MTGAFFVFLDKELFRMKKNNHKSEKYLINDEVLIP
ncbi:hypothetical protein M2347_002274 [Chryseobacterium sp. H1D6B]|nr:hypothetical protein [Chryseobacterium sp. H1D6B]